VLVRVLFVEEVEPDAELAVRRLRSDGVACAYQRVRTEQAYLDALHSGGHEIILPDLTLPQFEGMPALALAKRERLGPAVARALSGPAVFNPHGFLHAQPMPAAALEACWRRNTSVYHTGAIVPERAR
jgi:CheY-like chemotaxis protein